MVKTTIKETTERFDSNGKLVEKITREESSEDTTVYPYATPITPYAPYQPLYAASPITTTSSIDNSTYERTDDVYTIKVEG